ncbi:MAG: hypothetical protein INQ03_18010 [Candidatus Heimdallarchaeota archaeon]|nr:hypothetical protein [Candidatus Heimdallarchaeota archaeon]
MINFDSNVLRNQIELELKLLDIQESFININKMGTEISVSITGKRFFTLSTENLFISSHPYPIPTSVLKSNFSHVEIDTHIPDAVLPYLYKVTSLVINMSQNVENIITNLHNFKNLEMLTLSNVYSDHFTAKTEELVKLKHLILRRVFLNYSNPAEKISYPENQLSKELKAIVAKEKGIEDPEIPLKIPPEIYKFPNIEKFQSDILLDTNFLSFPKLKRVASTKQLIDIEATPSTYDIAIDYRCDRTLGRNSCLYLTKLKKFYPFEEICFGSHHKMGEFCRPARFHVHEPFSPSQEHEVRCSECKKNVIGKLFRWKLKEKIWQGICPFCDQIITWDGSAFTSI